MSREAPTPSATGWLLDLAAHNGPLLVVLRRGSDEAVEVAVGHLLDSDLVSGIDQARMAASAAAPQVVAVTW